MLLSRLLEAEEDSSSTTTPRFAWARRTHSLPAPLFPCQEGEHCVSHGSPRRCGRHHQLKMPHLWQNVQLHRVIVASERDILLYVVHRDTLIVTAHNVPLWHPKGNNARGEAC